MRNFVRIVGGEWRGRHIRVPRFRSIRPTPDRVRETLFNWLGSIVQGLRVVDLFAGTGALGFESLSRGAAHSTFVDKSNIAAKGMRETCQTLDLDSSQASVVCSDVLKWLRRESSTIDIAFVDPPFDNARLREETLALLRERIECNGLVYIEYPKRETIAHPGWDIWKSSKAGDVGFALLTVVEHGQNR